MKSIMQNNKEMLKTVELNGAKLHYLEQGKGRPVVLVHGSLGDYRTWKSQIEVFAQTYRVISYSRRYHYPNEWREDGKDYSAALHAEDLASFVKTLKISPVHLVASSFGAYASLIMSSRYPDLVGALVLGEPPMLPLLKESPAGNALFESFLQNAWHPSTQAFQTGNMALGVKYFIEGVAGKGMFERLPESTRSAMMENAKELAAETQSTNYFSLFTREEAQKIKIPVLFLTGQVSPKMFHVITDVLRSWMPAGHHIEIPAASHSMHSNNPAFYNDIVLKFLDAH